MMAAGRAEAAAGLNNVITTLEYVVLVPFLRFYAIDHIASERIFVSLRHHLHRMAFPVHVVSTRA